MASIAEVEDGACHICGRSGTGPETLTICKGVALIVGETTEVG
jgi:hypothetical protein